MPRPKANPYEPGTEEYELRAAEIAAEREARESQPKPTHRRLTVEVPVHTVDTAKMLAVLAGEHSDYRSIIGQAAEDMVEVRARKVREVLTGSDIPF